AALTEQDEGAASPQVEGDVAKDACRRAAVAGDGDLESLHPQARSVNPVQILGRRGLGQLGNGAIGLNKHQATSRELTWRSARRRSPSALNNRDDKTMAIAGVSEIIGALKK